MLITILVPQFSFSRVCLGLVSCSVQYGIVECSGLDLTGFAVILKKASERDKHKKQVVVRSRYRAIYAKSRSQRGCVDTRTQVRHIWPHEPRKSDC